MSRPKRLPHDHGMLRTAVLGFVGTLILVRVLWTWAAPDLMAGAVESGLVVSSLPWGTAVKISLVMTLLLALVRHRTRSRLIVD
jgi:uncharacterized protein (DUF2062 family)